MLIDEPERADPRTGGIAGEGCRNESTCPCIQSLRCHPCQSSFRILAGEQLDRECGYGLIYELSKDLRKSILTDELLLECIDRVRSHFENEDTWTEMTMGSALMGIGKRNKVLNQATLDLARELGTIDFSGGKRKGEPFDVAKHLTSESLKKKLGL